MLAAMAFGIAAVGTIKCAYFVPFQMTQGPPARGSVGNASSCWGLGTATIRCGGLTIQSLVAVRAMANGSRVARPFVASQHVGNSQPW